MPWKDPGWLQALIDAAAIWWEDAVIAFSSGIAVMLGLLAKISSEVKSGHRPRFFTRRLWLDVPAVVAMVAVAAGINVYFGLEGWVSSAVGVSCGWAGLRSIDIILLAVADRVRGGN